MSERERAQIAAAFERQEQLNRLLALNLLSVENDLLIEKERVLIEKERVRIMEEAFREEKPSVLENWPPQITEIEDIEETDKVSEMLTDMILDRGSHAVEDLARELNKKNFSPEKKQLFKSVLIHMGFPETRLNALKPGK